MNPRYAAVARRAGHRCEYCHAKEAAFNLAFEVKHIRPLALGGSNDEANLALACRSCNLHKSHFVIGTDEDTRTDVALFHPRYDRWGEHFSVDAETVKIRGLTPTGRATIARLRLNSPLQISARHQWIRLGLFP